ncbi:hypothetical protein AC623_17480 [Bacillus sp. FJAT-27231]|uniref:DUF6470 family protein n=1 Tax=Bacillus sp. FJAT-27231 TaxID=1679168 RepID=UPI0006712DCE|nr:DUF6470 family protein [Bacillus sp. FJAT-27231]KMY55509.1 hypothetical protein AC623_17480 [Bacillus sp. FJAT-27231]
MQVPQIRMTSQQAKIEMTTQQPVQSIEQPSAELDLQQPPAEMTIERTPARLTIDQTKAREDMDLKHISKRIEEAAQQGYQDWLGGLERVSSQGDELMMIENGGEPLIDQAKQNSEGPELEFNIGWIPSAGGVSIQYDPGKVDINVKVNPVINNTRPQKPIYNYQPGKINISMKQYPSLSVDFANLKYRGINYEQEI